MSVSLPYRRRSPALPALLTATLLALAAAAGAAEEEAYRGDVEDVVTIDALDPEGPYDKIWEPFIARWTDEHLIAAYGLQVRGKMDMGDIVCSLSLDGGRTWNERITVFDHRVRNGSVQYAYNNSVLFRPPDQDVVWLFVMRAPMHYRDSENADLVAAYTADGGYSWNHVELAMGYQGSLIIVAGIETVERDGVPHYLLPAHRNSRRHDPHGDRRQFVLESKSLLHWKLAGYVPYPDDDPVFLHEGKIAPIADGALEMVMRTATMDRERPLDPALAYSTRSEDGGRTWSTARPEPELPNYRAKSFFGRDSSGRHIYVYGDSAFRRGLYYKTRLPGGAWSLQRTFYDGGNLNSYPTLLEEPSAGESGEWLAVWDSSDDPERRRTAIRFGRLPVE
ncbi:MAG: exo-alpha-sialidase [Holophagales bacterium]|nr:exo-alpha-sialidase [Holophagales bacterium]MYD22775.1 exo-alpha-sialidase [Holophagales bacterium]MYI33346.1 exo-alpha-sialidase [Holophagales bacterium]